MITDYFPAEYRVKKSIARNAREILHFLSVELGERTLRRYENLEGAARFIRERFADGGNPVIDEEYLVEGRRVSNIRTEIPGSVSPEGIILIGAHYDTIEDTPGADDNATGIAGLLELFRLLSPFRFKRTLRFVAFTLEEPPYFSGDNMGSMVCARCAREREDNIELMICLEMLGYANRRYEQNVPFRDMAKHLPRRGDFLAVVSLPSSAPHTYAWKQVYNRFSRREIVDIVGPSSIPGISHSDHYSFNRHGYPAIMLTDTAFYRNKNYHTGEDTIDTINFKFLAEHVLNSFNTIRVLADCDEIVPLHC
ncbi:MAG: M28 family peptidase [Spirochaetes bacterium]|nr:M28 family peptidase [Spirochaetota bacterium]